MFESKNTDRFTEPQPSVALADGKNLAVAASADAAEGTGDKSKVTLFS